MRVPRAAALISITDPGAPQASLHAAWSAVLRVAFDDADALTFADDGATSREFSADDAAEIAAFVATASRRCQRIVVHCRHGVSRSAAVAKAIAESAGLPFPPGYSRYNRFVYAALRRPLAYALRR